MVALAATSPELVNRALDPSAESGVGGAQVSNNPSAYPITYDSTVFRNGTRSVTTTRLAATPNNVVLSVTMTSTAFTNSAKCPVTPGEVLSFGTYQRCDQPNWRGRLTIQWRDSANVLLSSDTSSPLFSGFAANTWYWVTAENEVAPANATHVCVSSILSLQSGGTTVGGERGWTDCCAVFSGPVCWDYFDGTSPSARWNGTPNLSTSTRLSLPFQRWDGSQLASLTPSGVWNGSAVQPKTFADVSVA